YTTRSELWQKMVMVTAPVLSYALCCFASHYSPPKNLGARPNWTTISVLHPGGRYGARALPMHAVGCWQQCDPLKRPPLARRTVRDNFDATLAVAGRFRAAVAI